MPPAMFSQDQTIGSPLQLQLSSLPEEKPNIMKKKIIKKSKYWLAKLLAEDWTAGKIAGGGALGVFIALLPIMGIQTLVAIPLSIAFRLNRVAALLGTMIMNPATFIPFYGFNFWVGIQILKSDIGLEKFKAMIAGIRDNGITALIQLGVDIFLPLLAGSLLVAGLSALVTFFVVRIAFQIYERRVLRPEHSKKA